MKDIRPIQVRARCCLLAWLTVAGLIAGCSGEPKREYADVTGKISYKGKPLDQGRVTFQPDAGAPGIADIQADGTYKLSAVVGQNTVMVVNRTPDPPPLAPDAERKRLVAAKAKMESQDRVVPPNYSTPASPLKFEVKKAGPNVADFDIE